MAITRGVPEGCHLVGRQLRATSQKQLLEILARYLGNCMLGERLPSVP